MKFDLENLNPGTAFEFEDGAKVYLRLANAEAMNDLRKKTTKKKAVFKNGKREFVEEVDEDLYQELLWDYLITDWNGMEDKNGDPIPCTKEMKCTLMNGSLKFARFVSTHIEELTHMLNEANEELEKN